MPVHAATIEILTEKARFEPRVAVAIAEAMDNAIRESQLVTIPVFEQGNSDLRWDIDVRFTNLQRDIDARFADFERNVEARFADFRRYVDTRFADFGRDMDTRFADFRGEIRGEIAESKVQMIRWMVAIAFTQTALLTGILALFVEAFTS